MPDLGVKLVVRQQLVDDAIRVAGPATQVFSLDSRAEIGIPDENTTAIGNQWESHAAFHLERAITKCSNRRIQVTRSLFRRRGQEHYRWI